MDNQEIQKRRARIEALRSDNASLQKKITNLEALGDQAAEKSRLLDSLRGDLDTIAVQVRSCNENSRMLMELANSIHSLVCGGTANQSEQDLISTRGEIQGKISEAEDQILQNNTTISRLEEEIYQLQSEMTEVVP